jgi:hypothetical protein
MGGGKGGGGSNVNVQPSPYEQALAQIATETYKNTANLRSGFLRDYENILGVGGGQPGPGQATGTVAPQYSGNQIFVGPGGQLLSSGQVQYGVIQPGQEGIGGKGATSPVTGYYISDPQTGQPVQVSPYGTQGGSLGYTPGTPSQSGQAGMGARYDPTQLPTYAPLFGLQKQGLESQYQMAKQNLMGATPRGGNLTGAMTGLEASRAANVGAMPAQLSSTILTDMLNKAYGAAFQAPTTTLSGLSTAAGTYGNRQAAAMSQSAADQSSTYGLLGSVGEGLGKAAGDILPKLSTKGLI